jgi:hypothetical protein
MAAKLLGIFISLIAILLPSSAFGHGGEAPVTVKINDTETKPYFIEDVLVSELVLPDDTAGSNFLVDEEVKLEVNLTELAEENAEIAKKVNIKWDFGDGKKAEGFSISHAYSKTGSYLLKVSGAKEDGSSVIDETILVNIIPDKDYKLPAAAITINGEKGTSENYNILDIDLNNFLTFDASSSKKGSSEIAKYVWDFGDDKSAVGKTVKHQYELPQAFATVILRVYDKNGLFTDATINVRNSGKNEPSSASSIMAIQKYAPYSLVLVILAGGYFVLRRGKK